MLNVGKIEEGFVLDHIKAGKSLSIYEHLQLDKLDCTVAIIKNARSGKMGKKDILKVECDIDMLDLDVLAFIDHNITVNVIKTARLWRKRNWYFPNRSKMSSNAATPDASLPSSRDCPTYSSSPMRKKRSTAVNTAKRNTAKAKNPIQQMPYQQPLVGHIYNTYSASSSVFFSLSSCFCIYIISNLT